MKNIAIPFLASTIIIIVLFVFFEDLESFFANFLGVLHEHPLHYASWSFLILSADILLPVPSSILMYTNGAVLGLWGGAGLSFVASLLAATVGYGIGYFAFWGIKPKEDERSAKILQKYGLFAIIISRGIPILAESICFTAGYNKMNFRLYLLLNIIGYIPICFIYAISGSLGANTNLFLLSFGISLLFSFLLYFFGKKYLIHQDAHS